MSECLERLRLGLALKEASSELRRILELNLKYIADADFVRIAELEIVIKQVEDWYRDTVAEFKDHVTAHGCLGTQGAPPDGSISSPGLDQFRPAPDENELSGNEKRKQLWEAVEHARREHSRLCVSFDAIVAQVPSGIPAPDGVLRIEQAGRARRAAFEQYQQALARFNDFALKGDGEPDGTGE